MGAASAGDEGLGLLRQQLSAVQRIRIEHERKDATIAALRLEVSGTEQCDYMPWKSQKIPGAKRGRGRGRLPRESSV